MESNKQSSKLSLLIVLIKITVPIVVFFGMIKLIDISDFYNLKVNKSFEPTYHFFAFFILMGLSFLVSYKSYKFINKYNPKVKRTSMPQKITEVSTKTNVNSTANLETLIKYIEKDRGEPWVQTKVGNINITKWDTSFWNYEISGISLDTQGKVPINEETQNYNSRWNLDFIKGTDNCVAKKFENYQLPTDEIEVEFKIVYYEDIVLIEVYTAKGPNIQYDWNENMNLKYYCGGGELISVHDEGEGTIVAWDRNQQHKLGANVFDYTIVDGSEGYSTFFASLASDFDKKSFMEKVLAEKLSSPFEYESEAFWFSIDFREETFRLVNGNELLDEDLADLQFILDHTSQKPEMVDLKIIKEIALSKL